LLHETHREHTAFFLRDSVRMCSLSTYLSGLLQSAKQIGEILKISMRVDGALDLIASYTFNLPPPAPAEVTGLAKDSGKNVKVKDGKEKNVMPVSTAE